MLDSAGRRLESREGLLVAALAALALGLRLWQLGEWSLWHDEALTVLLARRPVADIVAITANDVHPPLYYLLTKAFGALFPDGSPVEWAARLPSAVTSVGAVIALYAHGRQLFDWRTGLAAGLIMALSPIQLFYAQEARMYAPLSLLAILCALTFFKALSDGRRRWWALFGLASAAAAYTAYFIFPVLLALGLFLVLSRRRQALAGFLGAAALATLLYLPWLLVLTRQARAVATSYWIGRTSVMELFTTVTSFFVGVSLTPAHFTLALAAVLLAVAVALNSARHAWRAGDPDAGRLGWLLLWAVTPLVLTFLVSLVAPIYQLRTVLLAAPAFYLLVAWAVTRAGRRAVNLAFLVPTLAFLLIALVQFYNNPDFAKPPWRETAQAIVAQAMPGDVVIHSSSGSYLPFLAYDLPLGQGLLPEDPDLLEGNQPSQSIGRALGGAPVDMEAATAGHERAWLVVALDRAVEHQLAQKDAFDRRFRLVDSQSVGDIYVFLYETD